MQNQRENMRNCFSWMNPNLFVKRTETHGKGVFSMCNLPKDEILAIFGGYILSLTEEESLPKEFSDHGVQIAENFVLTVKKMEEIEDAGYFNHSCSPNAGFKGQIVLVAMRDIAKEEEITFDYAMVLHSARGVRPYKLECLCGADNCRHYISEDDWKNSDLQKKYKGYFQWYLQEKIDKQQKEL